MVSFSSFREIQPYVDDPELLTQIEEKTAALIRSIENTGTNTSKGQIAGQFILDAIFGYLSQGGKNAVVGSDKAAFIVVQFFERRTAKRIWFSSKSEKEVCWEQWIITVTLVNPRTDTGMLCCLDQASPPAIFASPHDLATYS